MNIGNACVSTKVRSLLPRNNDRPAFRFGVAWVFFSLALSSCASVSRGNDDIPKMAGECSPVFHSDPYHGWRRLMSAGQAFERAYASRQTLDARAAASEVCGNAKALGRFAREVDRQLRPEFLGNLREVTIYAARLSAMDADLDAQELPPKIASLGASIPRFWLTPAAGLRGARQPGRPFNSHE